jgi:hypothetical protein
MSCIKRRPRPPHLRRQDLYVQRLRRVHQLPVRLDTMHTVPRLLVFQGIPG